MTQNKYDLWKDACLRTAKYVAKDFPEVEAEDLFHDLILFVLENDNLKSPNDFGMITALNRKAITLSWEYRKQALYLTSQYCYRVSDIKKILEKVFHDDTWTTTYIPDDSKSIYDDDRMTANSDIKAAFQKLPDRYKKIINEVYLWRTDTDSNSKRRLNRAIERLADILNFYTLRSGYEGPGNQVLHTNEYERFIIEKQQNG